MADIPEIILALPKLYPKQYDAICCDARYSVVEASTKSGKTAGCIAWLLAKAWTDGKPGRNFWWIAPTHPVAKIAMRRISRMLSEADPARTAWREQLTESWIELASGGRIWFKGSDDPDNLYGEDVYAAVVDEATRCKEEAWHAIRSTLTATRGPVRIIGNVRGRKNWAYRMARRAEAGEPDMAYHRLTAHDAVEAGILEASEIADAERSLPADVFKELYLALPSDDGGNPFGMKAIADCILPSLSTAPTVAFGIDLAKSQDWTVVCGLDDQRRLTVFERWQSDWGQTRTRILDLISGLPALVDSTGVGDPIVEDLQRKHGDVRGFRFSSQSKQQIMEGLSVAIQRQEVGFPEGTLSQELETFEYVYTRTGVRYNAPDGLHDDCVCALALAVAHCRYQAGSAPTARLIGAGVSDFDDERGWR